MFISLIERQCLISNVNMFGVKPEVGNGQKQCFIKKENKKSDISFKSILENEIDKLNK